MIYLASRSHPKYLNKLIEISRRPESYHLVSIAGGLAFLHALNVRVESLVLVDSDPEVTEYVTSLCEIIVACQNRSEFFGLLSGREIVLSDEGKIIFSSVVYRNRDNIMRKVSPHAQACIARWYHPESFDDASKTMTAEDKTIHFFTLNLRHQHFNWHADLGCFETEDAYSVLNKTLGRLKPRILTMPLEDYDFSLCPRNTLVLASNTDSPLFTTNDSVLCSIERSKNNHCYYVSRTRDFSLLSSETNNIVNDTEFVVPPLAVAVPPSVIPLLNQSYPKKWRHLSSAEYCRELFYDQECILFWISEQHSKSQGELLAHLSNQAPVHQRVGILSDNLAGVSSFISELFQRYHKGEHLQVANSQGLLYSLKNRCPY